MSPGPLAVHDVGTGPVVVFLAGFGLDHRLWDGQVEHLSRTHRVVCVDLLGTGHSKKPIAGYSPDEQAQLVLSAVADLHIERFTLVGHSFGGIVAFAAAAARPKVVEKLILVGSNGVRAGRSAEFPFGARGEKLLPQLILLERTDRVAGRRRTLAAGFATQPDDAVLDYLTSIFLEMPSWSAISSFEQMYTTDQIDRIPAVSMPVSLIVGDRDRVHPLSGARWLQAKLAFAHLEVIPDVGHYPMLESPAALNTLLTAELGTSNQRNGKGES
ncbi:alpha/beta fold hydrolase [Rhodococcus qingshengii]|uniref:alpha/beta fold hydrolase n=1 Tax=Rhodococcus qingshengii TaxID=334542 RepID=UPI0010A64DA8|nr:alpha/beta hydrolase [Rhodococcus qingshengii]THJ67664.1 alpha/beta hydrolase [Rhodococcus qingshengii]